MHFQQKRCLISILLILSTKVLFHFFIYTITRAISPDLSLSQTVCILFSINFQKHNPNPNPNPISPVPSKLLSAQRQQQKYYKNLWKMFKVNNKNTGTTSLILISFWPFSNVSFVKFEQVSICWLACWTQFNTWHIFKYQLLITIFYNERTLNATSKGIS